MNNLFDRSSQQEFTWQSKHIKFFLDLKGIGPSAVEKIIETNPDIEQWDREYVASQSTNYEKTMQLLKDVEEIPSLQELSIEEVIHFKHPLYPKKLLSMKKNKPLLLWYVGNLNIEKSIAVVGSRKMITETAEVVDKFVEVVSSLNFSIVSGLANGVDEKAHISALENNAKTVAVLPSSLDNILPVSNKGLANEIVEQGGLLLTEYPPGSPKKPENSNYLMRNRIQAGISDAVFVAQSAIDGGTMTTAKHAIDNEKRIITYKSEKDIVEYSGNRVLTNYLDFDNEIPIKLSKFQKELIAKKNNVISDFAFETIDQIENIVYKILQ